MHTVVDPVYLFRLTASFMSYLGFEIYFDGYLLTNSSIIFTSLFEYNPGSTPESAHPPTPSATINTCFDA
jgi:hypothetical protein